MSISVPYRLMQNGIKKTMPALSAGIVIIYGLWLNPSTDPSS